MILRQKAITNQSESEEINF